jgi:hypothetical protein
MMSRPFGPEAVDAPATAGSLNQRRVEAFEHEHDDEHEREHDDEHDTSTSTNRSSPLVRA